MVEEGVYCLKKTAPRDLRLFACGEPLEVTVTVKVPRVALRKVSQPCGRASLGLWPSSLM